MTTTDDNARVTPPDVADAEANGPAPAAPRGFLLVIVAAMAALAGVIALGQWSQASSVARTGTTMMANAKARAIADTCLEQWLRYAKDGVDSQTWTDFDELLNQQDTGNVEVDDFIPPVTECTAVVYVPKSMSAAPEPRLGLHRYCAIRMDEGACLLRFDDNSDDGKTGTTLNADADEGTGATSGDNPRKDTDFSVVVTAIGIFPAKGDTPPPDLYERAEARATKRALIQIEIQASPTGWPSIHTSGTLSLIDGPGNGNWAVRALGAGGASAVTVSRGEAQDGCVCGYHAIGAQPTLSGNNGSCTPIDGFTCASGPAATAPKIMDNDATTDNTNFTTGAAGPDNEFDQDTPPPIPPQPTFTDMVAPGYAFANSFATQVVNTTNVPGHVTGSSPNPVCTYFFGGAYKGDASVSNPPTGTGAPYDYKARPYMNANRSSPRGRGRVYLTTGLSPPVTPGCSNRAPQGVSHNTQSTCTAMGTITQILGTNGSPRIAYIWDHSDTNVQATFTTLADMYDGTFAYDGITAATNAVFGNTMGIGVPFSNTPPAAPGMLDINNNSLNDDWPVAPIDCTTYAATSLPEPCDWEIATNASNDIIGVHINLNSCPSLHSMCWRPVAVFDNNDGGNFLSPNLAGGAELESTDVHGEEAFQPMNGMKVPLVKATADAFAGAATPPYTRYQDFCGQAMGLGGYSTTLNDNGVFYDSSTNRWSMLEHDIDYDEWPQRGTYWIFDDQGDAASRALDVANRLGGNGGRLKVGIIVDGAADFSDDDHEICCPTCNCNNGPIVDPKDNALPPADIATQKEIYSPGYFLFSREGCYLHGRPKRLNGDILCRFVGINVNANDPERIFSDVFGTGNCSTSGCSPSPTSLGNLPGWCGEPGFPGGFDDFGICMKSKAADVGAITSKGPWVGYIWSRADIFIGRDNAIAAPRAALPQVAVPFFPLPNHPEWPTLFSTDDIGLGSRNYIYGKVQVTSGSTDIWIGTDNRVYGRVVSGGGITFNSKNYVFWDGQGTTTTSVSDAVFYQDLGW